MNEEKTVVSYIKGVKFLGYTFYIYRGKGRLRVHPKSIEKMKKRIKELTSRSNGWGYEKRRNKLNEYANTRKGYWRIANSPIVKRSLTNKFLDGIGYIFFYDYYQKITVN